mmetsp:Transcript_79468/g.199754  ORF Transcript_79468/g.199754 Transcript_79468/m.199754 type:complete len:200 (-) Transcript_79468:220-819(-)
MPGPLPHRWPNKPAVPESPWQLLQAPQHLARRHPRTQGTASTREPGVQRPPSLHPQCPLQLLQTCAEHQGQASPPERSNLFHPNASSILVPLQRMRSLIGRNLPTPEHRRLRFWIHRFLVHRNVYVLKAAALPIDPRKRLELCPRCRAVRIFWKGAKSRRYGEVPRQEGMRPCPGTPSSPRLSSDCRSSTARLAGAAER